MARNIDPKSEIKKKYEFLEHTADVKFRAYGKSLEEAFSNAALALTSVIVDPAAVEARITKKISVKSEDEKALLYDFLEQFLILLDTNNFLLNSVKSIEIERNKALTLKAVIIGDTQLERYKPETHIKAVTYQEMEIKEKKNNCMVQVVLDL